MRDSADSEIEGLIEEEDDDDHDDSEPAAIIQIRTMTHPFLTSLCAVSV